MYRRTHINLHYLVNMEYQIQLANIFKTFVQCLDKHLNEIKYAQLRLGRIHTEHKVQCGIVSVDEFVVGASYQTGKRRVHFLLN